MKNLCFFDPESKNHFQYKGQYTRLQVLQMNDYKEIPRQRDYPEYLEGCLFMRNEYGTIQIGIEASRITARKSFHWDYLFSEDEFDALLPAIGAHCLRYATFNSNCTVLFLDYDRDKFAAKYADKILDKIKAIALKSNPCPQILYGEKECFLYDAGNRYTTIVWKDGATWKSVTDHVWTTGSAKGAHKRDIWLNQNTGDYKGTWKPFRSPEPATLDFQQWAQWTWDNQDSEYHLQNEVEFNKAVEAIKSHYQYGQHQNTSIPEV